MCSYPVGLYHWGCDMKIILKPINSRFKRLIHDFGTEWVAICDPVPMFCFGGENGIIASPAGNPNKVSNFKVNDIEFAL